MYTYIGIMSIAIGIIIFYKFRFKGSWKRLYAISIIAGFNKAVSGGGYGTLMTSGQILTERTVKRSVGITQLSEATLSTLGFIIYLIVNNLSETILVLELGLVMVLTGFISGPLGAAIVKKLDDEIARKTVGIASVCLGLLMLVYLAVSRFLFF